MYKSSLLPLFLLILSINCIGQNNIRITLGVNSGNISPSTNTTSFQSKVGYQAGIEGQFGNKFYFQPGLFYNIKKNLLKHSNTTIKQSKLSIGSVRIPLFVGYKINQKENKNWDIYLFSGPSVSILTSIKHSENEIISIGDDELHDVEWTWSLGAGVNYKMFFFELGYEHGLTYTFISHSAKRKMIFSNVGFKLFI